MEELRPMTAKEKLCHVSNQMFVYLMACKHLTMYYSCYTANVLPPTLWLWWSLDSIEITRFKNYIFSTKQQNKLNFSLFTYMW